MQVALLHEVADLDSHLDEENIEEVVMRLYDGIPRQCPFAMDIGLTELLFVEGQLAVLTGLPQDFGPMDGSGVDGAAIVEDEGFDVVHNFLFFLGLDRAEHSTISRS